MTDRYQQVISLLDEEQGQYDTWAQSEEVYPDEPYWTALEAALAEFRRGELPGRLTQAAQYAMRLEAEYDRFNQTGSAVPGTEFWGLRASLQTAARREPPTLPPLQSVADLVKSGVSHIQAARIWKLIDENDRPKTGMVEKELAEPGSVITEEWKAHVNKLRLKEAGFADEPVTAKAPDSKPHVPSIEEMIEQRATFQQIVNVKSQQYGNTDLRDWTSAVSMIAAAMGAKLGTNRESVLSEAGAKEVADRSGENAIDRPASVRPTLEPREIEDVAQQQEATEPGGDIEDQIIALHDAGHDPRAIQQHLNVSLRKVNSVIKKWDEELQGAK